MTFLNPQASFNPFRASLGTQQTTCSIREHLPTREAKDSEHPDPTGGGKDSMCTVKQGIYIYPRKHKRPPSGRQAKVVCKTMGTTGRSPISSRHPQTGLSPTIQGSSIPCIHSGYNEIEAKLMPKIFWGRN